MIRPKIPPEKGRSGIQRSGVDNTRDRPELALAAVTRAAFSGWVTTMRQPVSAHAMARRLRSVAPRSGHLRSASSRGISRSSITARPRAAITPARAGSQGDGAGAPFNGSVSASGASMACR